jgi:3-oxoadipate enol-lactonase
MSGPAGAPVLVLGNSLGTTRELWEPQLDALGQRFRLLRYEHRGHGGSPAPPGPYAISGLGADVLALLDDFEVGTAYYAGVSLGGMVGIWLAANAPDRVEALALCCTSACLQPAELWLDRAAAVRSGGLGSISKQVVGRWFTAAYEAAHPGTVARFVTTLEQDVIPEGYAGCCDAIAAMDLTPDLSAIGAPTLVLAAEHDPSTPPEHGRRIAELIPGARFELVSNAAHLASVERPDLTTMMILRFLSDE